MGKKTFMWTNCFEPLQKFLGQRFGSSKTYLSLPALPSNLVLTVSSVVVLHNCACIYLWFAGSVATPLPFYVLCNKKICKIIIKCVMLVC